MRYLPALAWVVAGIEIVFMLGAAALVTLDRGATFPDGATPWPGSVVASLDSVPLAIVGALIASRLPGNPYGWLWLLVGMGKGAFVGFFTAYALHSEFVSPLPAESLAVAIASLGFAITIVTFPFLLLLFPTGTPAGRPWNWVTWLAAIVGGVVLATGWAPPVQGSVVPGMSPPFAIDGPWGDAAARLMIVCVYAIFGFILLGAVSLVFRFRAARDVERQQLKWLTYAAAILGGSIFASETLGDLPGIWDAVFEAVTLWPIPIAVAIAILRHRLYEIDLLIRRTLVYALLSACLAAMYLAAVGLLQTPVRSLTGGDSQLAVVAATLLVALVFSPLRRKLQSGIDRAFYRQRYDARATLAALTSAVRTEVDLEPLTDAVVAALRDSVQPTHASIWLRAATSSREDASETPRRYRGSQEDHGDT